MMIPARSLHEELLQRRDLIEQAKGLAKNKSLVEPRPYHDYLKYCFVMNASGSAFMPSRPSPFLCDDRYS